MKPTALFSEPWIEPNGKRGVLIFETDKGLLSVKEISSLLGKRAGTFYERYRRLGVEGLRIYGIKNKIVEVTHAKEDRLPTTNDQILATR